MEEKLEQLIITSSYDELSPGDREYVLSMLSETDYDTYHALLPEIISCLTRDRDSLSPSPEIIRQLKNKLSGRRRNPFALHSLLDPINLNFSGYSFHFPAYKLIFLAATALIIWLPIRLSHGIKTEPIAQKTQRLNQTDSPRINDLALNDGESLPERKTSKILFQQNKTPSAQPSPSSLNKNVSLTEKYPCYDIAVPVDHAENNQNQDIKWNANAPGLHANLLIPEFNPLQADSRNSSDQE